MKSLFSVTFLLAGLLVTKAQQYKPVDEKSDVEFVIKNFGLNTSGSLNGLKGSINFDPANPGTSSFNVTVDAHTVNTGSEARDNHLRKEEYFDVEKYPAINFVSTAIKKNENGYAVTGNLTIKGVTRSITFPFSVENQENGIQLTGEFNINRRDFGVGGSSAVLSDNVNVSLKVFANKS
jgi:polyisoprenoid-binding protein YceI